MNILISDKKRFEGIKNKIKADGLDNLHFLADFDRTLTYGLLNGVKTSSIISILRDGNHLSPDYAKKAHDLFDKYHPIEVDSTLPIDHRRRAMSKWWEEHNNLLIDSGLNINDLKSIAENDRLKFREGVFNFLDFLHQKKIPLIIFSASGCGEAIELFFDKHNRNYPNILYIINKFNWDNNGNAVSIKGLIIHSLNKNETILKDIPSVYNIIKEKRNIILLGDSIGDLGMASGFDYKNLLTIGFLNPGYNKNKDDYLNKFDVVLEGDKDVNFINNLLQDLS
jgi:cytosolic 5'-nucleotidase 3